VAHLVRPPASTEGNEDRARLGGWTSSTHYGGGPGADPATIQFVKTRTFPSCQMHYVRFTNRFRKIPCVSVIRTWREEGGRVSVGPLGGGGADEPAREDPWVNMTAGWTANRFMGGGSVIGDGAENASLVRLTFTNGAVADDTVENGVVLFVLEPVEVVMPAVVTVLDATGTALVTYQEFEGFADTA
jgi:hypothetical protein